MTKMRCCVTMIFAEYGEMSEWFKELVLKTSDPATGRGFESHSLRHMINPLKQLQKGCFSGFFMFFT